MSPTVTSISPEGNSRTLSATPKYDLQFSSPQGSQLLWTFVTLLPTMNSISKGIKQSFIQNERSETSLNKNNMPPSKWSRPIIPVCMDDGVRITSTGIVVSLIITFILI